jgi:acetyl-CoA synthetase
VATALADGQAIDRVLVVQRTPDEYRSSAPLVDGRDVLASDLLRHRRHARVAPVPMPAEAPLFLMYTSGSTGKPKACVHNTGGYFAYVSTTAPTENRWSALRPMEARLAFAMTRSAS